MATMHTARGTGTRTSAITVTAIGLLVLTSCASGGGSTSGGADPAPSGDDRVVVADLALQERQGRDRARWDQMRDVYWEDSQVSLSWFQGTGPDFVDASEEMVAGGSTSVHRLSPPFVQIDGDRALIEVPSVIEAPAEIDGVAATLNSYARIQYRAERRDDEWRLSALDTIYEYDTIVPLIPGEEIAIDPGELVDFRQPYQLLSWVLTSRGFEVDDTLLAEDRPEEIAEFYADELAWLHGE